MQTGPPPLTRRSVSAFLADSGDCCAAVDYWASNRLSSVVQTLPKRAALLEYVRTVEPSLIEKFAEQVGSWLRQ